jgi:hypothetical protein
LSSASISAVARELLAAGHYDNEPDAICAAIWLIAGADYLRRAGCMASHPSSLPALHVA